MSVKLLYDTVMVDMYHQTIVKSIEIPREHFMQRRSQ